jgi:hypothetical protein
MPNRKAKEAMKAAKQAEARQRDKAGRGAELEKERARLRAQAVENDLAGKPSIVSALPGMSVRERKLQRENKGSPSVSFDIGADGLVQNSGELKGRVLSKDEILAARKRK